MELFVYILAGVGFAAVMALVFYLIDRLESAAKKRRERNTTIRSLEGQVDVLTHEIKLMKMEKRTHSQQIASINDALWKLEHRKGDN